MSHEEVTCEEAEWLRLALESSRIGTWCWHCRSKTLQWSAEHFVLFGYEPFGLSPTYEMWSGRVHPEDLPSAEAAMHRSIALRTDYRLEYRIVLPGGSLGWVEARGRPYYDEHGECVRVMGTIIDVTERKQAEQAAGSVAELQAIGPDITERILIEQSLHQSNQRFEMVLKTTDDVIFDWNIETDDLWWNTNGEVLLGSRGAGKYGIDCLDEKIHPADRPTITANRQKCLTFGEELWEAEYRLCTRDGRATHVRERGCIVRNAAGLAVRMIGALSDVSHRKRLDEAHRKLAHAARLAVVGELSASIAHEVSQPLAGMLANAEAAARMIEAETPPSVDEMKEILADIREAGLRTSKVVSRLRDLMQDRRLESRPVDLNDVAAEAVRLVRVEAAKRRVRIETRLTPLPVVQGDRVQLQQVLLNLLVNAMDACSDTSENERVVVVRSEADRDGAATLRVIDTGRGIAVEQLPRLFDWFYTSKDEGMGLGLSIARLIVEAHGGTVVGRNNPSGNGATFRIGLPAGTAHASGRPPVAVGPSSP